MHTQCLSTIFWSNQNAKQNITYLENDPRVEYSLSINTGLHLYYLYVQFTSYHFRDMWVSGHSRSLKTR